MSKGRGRRNRNQREIRRETRAQRSPPIDRVPSTTSSSTPASTSAAVPQIPLQDIAGYTAFLNSYVPVGSLVVEHSDNFESRCKWTLPAAISTIRRRYIRCNEFRLGDFCCCILLNPNGTLQISLHLAVGRHDHTRWDKLFRFTLGFLRPPSDDLVFAQQFRARMHDSAPIYGNESFVIATDVADCTAIQVCARLMDETWETSPGTAGHNPGMCYTHLKWGLEASESRGFLIDRKDILSPIFELAKDLFCSVDLRRTMDGDLSAVVKTHMSPADCENCLVFGNIRMSSGDYEPLSGRASTGDSSDEIVVRLMEYTVFLNSDALIVGGKYELCCSLYHIKDKGRFKSFEGEGILGGTYKWRIKNLAQLKKLLKKNRGSRSVKSSTFCIGPYSCQLVLYPRGISEPNAVSVYLEISKSSDTNVHVSAKHLICLVNHKDENKSFTREIEAIHNPGAGWPAFCSSAQFFDPDVGFYREDEITFISKVQILLEESPLKADCHQEPEKVSEEANKLYIVLISLHGLIRGENMELGRDSDTGDQVKYVVELARALGASPGVHRVDLLTRKVTAPDVHWNYSVCAEKLSMQNDENDAQEHREGSGAYIIRIPFGPTNKYLEKEQLWPHISEFVDRALCHVSHISKVLGEQIGGGQPVWPAIIHGHYADAGDSAALLSGALNVPMLFTAHSLGRGKLEQLLKQGRISKEDIDSTYRVMRRIEGEELCLDASEMIITSTRQEIEEQWSLYDGFDLVRDLPRMIVISPGMEFHHIVPHDADPHADTEGQEESNATLDPPIWSEIMRFLTNKHKPMILALSRLEPIKNLTTLVKAYGECCSLREHANLILMMGNRKDIEGMSETNASVLTSILNLIDKYDLYGHVAYPKHHKLSDIPDIYRLAAKTKGVFINPAFIEPSGLTSIEAAACGLPIVATKNGGDVDIVKTLDNGLLIDPHDQQSIAEALLKLVGDKQVWERCRQNGLKNFCLYPSWTKHCEEYLSLIARCEPRQLNWNKTDTGDEESESDSPDLSMILKLSLEGDKTKISTAVEEAKADAGHQQFPAFRRREHIFVIAVDSDKTSDLLQIIKTLFQICSDQKNAGSIGFILSTALTISEVKSLFASADVSLAGFDAFICNSGSELYYPLTSTEGSSAEFPFVQDDTYHSHIEYRWGGEDLRKTLVEWSKEGKTEGGGQIIVEDESISSDRCYTFKVNDLASLPSNKELRKLLRNWAVRCHAIYCQNGTRVNVIPVLASRSQALRYLYLRWGTELTKFVVVVGEYGYTDYEGLLGGVHKTIVMKGVCHDSRKLHTNRNYPLDHVTPYDSTNMVKAEGCEAEALKAALGKLAILKA